MVESSYLGKETQVTQSGQAVALNVGAISQLAATIRSGLGPNGATKMLITSAGDIRIIKDGSTLFKNVQLAQPGAVLASKMVSVQEAAYGDGVTSTILMAAAMLNEALEYIYEGIHPQSIISGLIRKERDVLGYIDSHKIETTDASRGEHIKHLARTALRTKFPENEADALADKLIKAISTVTEGKRVDLKMLEVVKMMSLDSIDPIRLVAGLVLDHGGRHPMMPKKLNNVFILCTNISFEYEKPEMNAQFYYKGTEEKRQLEEGERRILTQRLEKVIRVMQELARENQALKPQFMVITQKGIDQYALGVFAQCGILALRRAKKRNMERLQKLTGAKSVGSIEEVNKDSFGFAGSVREVSLGEDKFTFIEQTPFQGTCTILVQSCSSYQMEYTASAVNAALKAISNGISDGAIVPGGGSVFFKAANDLNLSNSTEPTEDKIASSIWKKALLSIPKALSKNFGHNSVEALTRMAASLSSTAYPTLDVHTGDVIDALDSCIVDNLSVTRNVIQVASLLVAKVLMVDEIVKSGKEVK